MTGPNTDFKKLGARFPCCGKATTHTLVLNEPRDLTCTPCGHTYTVVAVPCHEHVETMAGQPIARLEWTFKNRTETKHG